MLGSYSVRSLSDSSPEDILPSDVRERNCDVGAVFLVKTCGVAGLEFLLLHVENNIDQISNAITHATLASREASVNTSSWSCSERRESSYSFGPKVD